MMHAREIAREAFRPLEAGASSRRYLLAGLFGLVLLVALTALNQWLVRRWFSGASYLRLYLNYGYLASLGFTLLTLLINLDQERDLISSHPFRYIYSCLQLIRVPLQIVLRRDTALPGTQDEDAPHEATVWHALSNFAGALANILDQFFSGFFTIIFILVLLVWLWLIAPLQYFIYLICGAPARVIDRTNRTHTNTSGGNEVHAHAAFADESAHAEGPWLETSYFSKPVRMTSALAAVVLWGLSKWF